VDVENRIFMHIAYCISAIWIETFLKGLWGTMLEAYKKGINGYLKPVVKGNQ